MEEKNKFLDFLNTIPVRLEIKRDCDKSSTLSEEEMLIIQSIRESETKEDACAMLKPLYQKYKGIQHSGKRTMPELIIRCIYFIIYRECDNKIQEDLEKTEKERKFLEADDTLRRKVILNASIPVFKALGEKGGRVQERMGIQPIKDFMMLRYEPIDMHLLSSKGFVFKKIFLWLMMVDYYPMFIDLTGEDSVLGDIFYGAREIICCHDTVVLNFYQALLFEYKELSHIIRKRINDLDKDREEKLNKYRKNLVNERKKYSYGISEKWKISNEKLKYEAHSTIPTFPSKCENIDVEMACQYLIVMLEDINKGEKEEIQDKIETKILYLRERLKNVIFSWVNVKDILSVLNNGQIVFTDLTKEGEQKTPDFKKNEETGEWNFYENFSATIDRRVEVIRGKGRSAWHSEEKINQDIAEYKKKHDFRVKKGFLYFDYTVRKDDEEARAFADFIKEKRTLCSWAFICKKEDTLWIETLKGENVDIIELNEESNLLLFFTLKGLPIDIVIITNVRGVKIPFEEIAQKFHLPNITAENLIKSKTILVRNSVDRQFGEEWEE